VSWISKAAKNAEEILSLAYQHQNALSERPSLLMDLPKKLSGDFKYFVAKLAHRDIPVVLDSYQDLKHSVLYLDTNGDGHLSDEKGYSAQLIKHRGFSGEEYRFGPVSVEVRDIERKEETKFYAKTYNGRQLFLFPAAYHVGKARLGKNAYKVAVIDGNFDGRYDKLFSPPVERLWSPGCDSFAIDLNGDGRFNHNYYSRDTELMPLSMMVQMKGAYYSVGIAPDGTALELKKAEPKFGTLDLGGAKVKLKLWSDAAAQYRFYLEKNWQLPAGKYAAIFMELHKRDSSGNEWNFNSSRKKCKLDDFEIRPGETTSFEIGPPFQIKTTAEQSSNTMSICFDLEGQAGELYSPGARRNDRRISEPGFKIIDESGKALESGRFKYG